MSGLKLVAAVSLLAEAVAHHVRQVEQAERQALLGRIAPGQGSGRARVGGRVAARIFVPAHTFAVRRGQKVRGRGFETKIIDTIFRRGDFLLEGNETVSLILANATGGARSAAARLTACRRQSTSGQFTVARSDNERPHARRDQGSGPDAVYYNNIAIVPEPGGIVLSVLAAAPLWIRRRGG